MGMFRNLLSRQCNDFVSEISKRFSVGKDVLKDAILEYPDIIKCFYKNKQGKFLYLCNNGNGYLLSDEIKMGGNYNVRCGIIYRKLDGTCCSFGMRGKPQVTDYSYNNFEINQKLRLDLNTSGAVFFNDEISANIDYEWEFYYKNIVLNGVKYDYSKYLTTKSYFCEKLAIFALNTYNVGVTHISDRAIRYISICDYEKTNHLFVPFVRNGINGMLEIFGNESKFISNINYSFTLEYL